MKQETKNFLKRYEARVEFLALKEEVDRLLNLGHSKKTVYENFKNNNEITMCYSSFCNYIKRSKGFETSSQKHSKNVSQI